MRLRSLSACRRPRVLVAAVVAGLALISLVSTTPGVAAQSGAVDAARAQYDTLLDLYVRDGLVYYRAMRSERAKLDAYLNAIASASLEGRPANEQIAFWLNAYNALVLRSIVDQYPIPQRSKEYPPHSVRQIPGVFERTSRRVAQRALTLDQIEQTVLPAFNDPRLFLALGRGAIGSGRLRSEAYSAEQLERQLTDVATECVRRATCIDIDRDGKSVKASSIFSWRESQFTSGYTDKADARFASRSPIERAVLGFIAPRLLATEAEFIERNEFQLRFIPFDWSLNEL